MDAYERLYKFIEDREKIPFEWGKQDCVNFAIRAIEAFKGVSGVSKYCTWRSEYEAMKILKVYGDTLLEAVRNLSSGIGLKEKDKALINRGDIVVYQGINGHTCGVCIGDKIVCPGTFGLIYLPIKNIEILGCFKIEV